MVGGVAWKNFSVVSPIVSLVKCDGQNTYKASSRLEKPVDIRGWVRMVGHSGVNISTDG